MINSITDILIGLFFGVIIGSLITISYSQPEKVIIRHGCAQYNNITGDFEWKENNRANR